MRSSTSAGRLPLTELHAVFSSIIYSSYFKDSRTRAKGVGVGMCERALVFKVPSTELSLEHHDNSHCKLSLEMHIIRPAFTSRFAVTAQHQTVWSSLKKKNQNLKSKLLMHRYKI